MLAAQIKEARKRQSPLIYINDVDAICRLELNYNGRFYPIRIAFLASYRCCDFIGSLCSSVAGDCDCPPNV
jgi:hypothetical protein